MGVIVNPRGTSGSGKTELVRLVLNPQTGPAGTQFFGHVQP
jgi:hypothetical protein